MLRVIKGLDKLSQLKLAQISTDFLASGLTRLFNGCHYEVAELSYPVKWIMSPNVEQVLTACPDSVVIFSHRTEQPFLCSLDESVRRGAELSDKGYGLAGVLATFLDGDVGFVSEPGCEELCGRVFANFLFGLAKRKPEPESGDSLAWLEALGRLDDPR